MSNAQIVSVSRDSEFQVSGKVRNANGDLVVYSFRTCPELADLFCAAIPMRNVLAHIVAASHDRPIDEDDIEAAGAVLAMIR